MELIFIWIKDDGKTIKEKGFNFSNHIRVIEKIDQSSYLFKLEQDQNYIEGFFNNVYEEAIALNHADVVNVTGIIGENGSGKTNLLKYIADVISTDNLSYRKQVLIFKNKDTREIHIYNTLDELVTIEGAVEGYTTLPVVNTTHYPFEGPYDHHTMLENEPAKNSVCIYYSPVFDLNEYPLMIDNNSKSYIDVSTNGLIAEDTFYDGIYVSENHDRIKLFRRSNFLRQFELINFFVTRETATNLIPVQVKLQFDREHFDPDKGKRNLTVTNEEIFEFIDGLIDPAFNSAHRGLEKFDRTDSNSQSLVAYKRAKSEKIKVEFIYCFLHNFFKNLEMEFHAEIGLSLKDFEKATTLLEAATILFTKQNWQGYKGPIMTAKLFEKVLTSIDQLYKSDLSFDADDTFITTNAVEAREITNLYYNYLESIPSQFKSSFLSIAWRNVSSGEQALLDLYSRLAYALSFKVKDKEEKAKKPFEYVYLLIDEGESGFHPQWQKRYLFLLLEFIYQRFVDYRVQVILSSHSPFIVSDLPKNNLIFLNKTDGYTEIVKVDDLTFAANIHTLFAHQFFIGDGVKGAFAQKALETYLIPFIQDSKAQANDTVSKFIELIGEPVLKEKLEEIKEEREQGNV